jgi:branched-chain amino acid transport system substrate-binding protein
MQPVALAMKDAGVNGFLAAVGSDTYLALARDLRILGVVPKTAEEPFEGSDVLQSGSVQAAQGLSFFLPFEPPELQTAATQRFRQALQATGTDGEPNFEAYEAYASVLMFVRGLQAAGAHPSQASYITALNGVHDFTADGLLGSHQLDVSARARAGNAGVDDCEWYLKLVGSSYQLVPGAEPLCGTTVPGKVS